jgi:hypothetical protein
MSSEMADSEGPDQGDGTSRIRGVKTAVFGPLAIEDDDEAEEEGEP